MGKTLEQKLQQLSADQLERVEQRASELIAEEMSLRDLRKAMALTQDEVAQRLKMRQEGVSRLEKRTDMLLSTLQSYVAAMGGELKLVATFSDRPPIHLSSLTNLTVDEHGVEDAEAMLPLEQ